MKIFEFIFNPKSQKDLVFDSFCYKPKNIYEKNKGHLCMVGLLRNCLPNNIYLIRKIARTIKERYFQFPDSNIETSFKRGLKDINDFLSRKADSGNTSWLGDLSFLALSIKKRNLIFSKTGDIKFLVVRNGDIIDIDEKMKYNESSPYPIKVFSRTISSKLGKNDLILVFTRNVYDYFKKKNLLDEVIQSANFKERKIKKILAKRKKEIANIRGVFLGIFLGDSQREKSKKTTLKKLKHTSLKKMMLSFFKSLKEKGFPKINISIPKRRTKPTIKSYNKDLSFFSKYIRPLLSKRKLFLIGIILVSLLGFSFFKFQEYRKIENYQKEISAIEEKIVGNQQNNQVLQEAWSKLSFLEQEVEDLSDELSGSIASLQDQVRPRLYELNKLEDLKNPELVFNFQGLNIIPKKIFSFGENIYFYNDQKESIVFLDEDYNSQTIELNKKISYSSLLDNSPILFSKPNQITILSNNKPSYFYIKESEKSFDDFDTFGNNLYFLDSKTGEIIKYPFIGSFQWNSPSQWLSSDHQRNVNAQSFTIDRSIWVLKNNFIYEYYMGEFVKEISIETFPQVQSLSKILTSPDLSNIYIAEPEQKRIIIIDKEGEILKQFRSDNFDNLLDFSVSQDEESLYILNGLEVYKIDL